MKMNIETVATRREPINVELDIEVVLKTIIARILSIHQIPPDAYIEGGQIVTWDPCRGGSGLTEVAVANPTLAQLTALQVCQDFSNLIQTTAQKEKS
jgi:hypothetical protein